MTISADSQLAIDAYLKVLRKRLRGLSEQVSDDVVKEIRSHILDKASIGGQLTPGSVASVLTDLGSPEELARQYVTDDLLVRAQVTRSPWLVLRSLFRWASLSFVGLCILTFSVLGYFLAGSFALCAMLKPIHPQTAGLWLLPSPEDDYSFSLRLGFSSPPGTQQGAPGMVDRTYRFGLRHGTRFTHVPFWTLEHSQVLAPGASRLILRSAR